MPTVNARNKCRSKSAKNSFADVKTRPKWPTSVLQNKNQKPAKPDVERSANELLGDLHTRGYLKISAAAKALKVDFRSKLVLDIGSSTGGFTEYALDHGASKVIAVEKGTHQMRPPLRFDKRVELHEKTDIFGVITSGKLVKRTFREHVTSPSQDYNAHLCERVGSPACQVRSSENKTECCNLDTVRSHRSRKVLLTNFPDIILADVSFLSLTKILKYASIYLTGSNTQFLVMLKPQFEAQPHQLSKGIVKNEAIRRQIIKNFEQWLRINHFATLGKRDNHLSGRHGNTERFYHLAQIAPTIYNDKHYE